MTINLLYLTGYDNAEAFVNLWMGEPGVDHKRELQEMFTNDHHRMWFYTLIDTGHILDYYAFIDFQKEKNCVVEINGLSEKYRATFDRAEFQDVCKSLTFIDRV